MKKIFIPTYYKSGLKQELLENILKKVSEEKVGIFTTVQFLKQLKQLKTFLQKNKKKAFEVGQVLGCNVTAPLAIEGKVDCFIYLGSGLFHQLALAIKTKKKIYQANPLSGEVSQLKEETISHFKLLKSKTVSAVKSSKRVGILVSTKPGQHNMALAKQVAKKLEAHGKEVFLFMFETLAPEELYNFPDIEAWVNTACPRIALDDIERFPKPVANAEDIL